MNRYGSVTLLYHRERISKSSTLSCNEEKGGNHQTSHKMRARPYYYGCSLKDEGAPPLFEGAPPLLWVLSTTNQHLSTSPNLPPPTCLQHQLIHPPPIPRSGGDHIPLHPSQLRRSPENKIIDYFHKQNASLLARTRAARGRDIFFP